MDETRQPFGGGQRRVIRVAVVDENDIFRRGVVACLEGDDAFRVVFDARTGPVTGPADVIFASEKAAAGMAGQSAPKLVCSDSAHSDGLGLGPACVDAVLPRQGLTEDQVVAAARAAASGLRVEVGKAASEIAPGGISERTVVVLRLLAEGRGTREISDVIGFSERTVKSIIRQAEHRLGARSRAHAVAEAIRQGFI